MSGPKKMLPKWSAFIGIMLLILLAVGICISVLRVGPAAPLTEAKSDPAQQVAKAENVAATAAEPETTVATRQVSPRTPLPKPEGRDLQLTVKFRDDLRFRANRAGDLTLANGDRVPKEVAKVINDLNVRFEPMYSPEMLAKLSDLATRAEQRTGNKQPDFSATLVAIVPANLSAEERYTVANQLNALDVVDYVELTSLDQLPPPPGDIAPPSADLTGNQTYLAGNPGVNAQYAWNLGPGYKGQGIRLSDCEYGYRATHEDLVDSDITDSSSAPIDPEVEVRGWDKHGTAVVGVLAATHNSYGVSGIAADAEVHFYSEWTTNGYSRTNSVAGAVTDSALGDVVLLEMQTTFAGDYAPAETNLSIWNLVKTASDAGVIVVAAAGNGNRDMDSADFDDYHARGDSGSIIVGAGSASSSHNKMSFSTFGERVDVHAWGQSVASTGYGTLAEYGDDANQRYTSSFSGTSSASNLTAGAVTVIQSYCEQALGYRIDSLEMRALLKTTGVAQGSGGNIGPHVNIKNAIEYLQVGALPPFDVTASDDEFPGEVRLSWQQMSGATGYEIFRGTTATQSASVLIGSTGSASATNFTDNSSGSFFYWVRTVTAAGGGHFSDVEAGSAQAIVEVDNLTATDAAFTDRVDLTWDSLGGAISYTVLRGTSTNVAQATEIATGVTTTTYSDTTAAQATVYRYWVLPIFSAGPGDTGDYDGGYLKLTPPTGLAASDLTNQYGVNLTWDQLSGGVKFNIFRSSTNDVQSAIPIATSINGNTFLDTTAPIRTTYYYWITGSSTTFGNTDHSLPDAGTRAAPRPSSPSAVTATDNSLSGRISITWIAPPFATDFEIFRAVGADAEFSDPATALIATIQSSPYQDTDVQPGTIYRYWVRALNESGPNTFATGVDTGGANVASALPDPVTANPGSSAAAVATQAKGTYFGLIESTASSEDIVGWINTLRLRHSRGIPKFSARIYWGQKRVSLRGEFEPDGSFALVVPIRRTDTELMINLQYAESDGGFAKITGTISDGTQTGTVDLNRRVFTSRNRPPENWQGRWTTVFPAADENNHTPAPVGDGAGTVSTSRSGRAGFRIRLGDGTAVSIASYISGDGEIPLFKAYKSWRGKFAGEFRYNELAGISDWDGIFDWELKAHERSKLFPKGFETTVPGLVARFVRPLKEAPYVLNELAATDLNAVMIMDGGNLGFAPGSHPITWSDRNRVTLPDSRNLSGRVSPSSGAFSGRLILYDGDRRVVLRMFGVAYQAQGVVLGYFLGDGETGRIAILPNG